MSDYEMEQPEAPEYDDDVEFDEGNAAEAAEEIELLMCRVHAARQCGA
jgi:hypothetical protein